VFRVAELNILKWALRDEVFAGSRLDYGILVSNNGDRATNLVVTDTLPVHTAFGDCDCVLGGLRPASASEIAKNGFCGAPFSCGLEGNAVMWKVEKIAANRSLQKTFWVTAALLTQRVCFGILKRHQLGKTRLENRTITNGMRPFPREKETKRCLNSGK
jgi:uncharacterized repeat protein (TIGR01451 family)